MSVFLTWSVTLCKLASLHRQVFFYTPLTVHCPGGHVYRSLLPGGQDDKEANSPAATPPSIDPSLQIQMSGLVGWPDSVQRPRKGRRQVPLS